MTRRRPTPTREATLQELDFLRGDTWFGRTTLSLQSWRSAAHLMDHATGRTGRYLPARQAFTRRVGDLIPTTGHHQSAKDRMGGVGPSPFT